MPLTYKQIKLVFAACRQLGISEQDRHRVQKEITGKKSLTRMNQRDWELLVDHLRTCGANIQAQGSKLKAPSTVEGLKAQGPNDAAPPARADFEDPLMRKLFKCWDDLEAIDYYEPEYKWKALREFIHKRFHVAHWRFLDDETKIKVIEALKAIKARQETHRVAWD